MVDSSLKPAIVKVLAAGGAMTCEELRLAIGAPSANYIRLLANELVGAGVLEVGRRRTLPGKPYIFRLRTARSLSAA